MSVLPNRATGIRLSEVLLHMPVRISCGDSLILHPGRISTVFRPSIALGDVGVCAIEELAGGFEAVLLEGFANLEF